MGRNKKRPGLKMNINIKNKEKPEMSDKQECKCE